MPAYVTVQLKITDQAAFDEYRAVAMPALAKHGAKPLSSGQAEVLFDADVGQTPAVLLEFPSADAARAWIDDPELVDVHALRNKGAAASITLLPLMG
ncbi:MAG: DUF1330 domain-containing protein [Rhodobacteraceae bacterium]|nr:DUF1330 domain-containing protein [Paracoccaceae bacterium]